MDESAVKSSPSVELVVRKTKSSVVWNPVDGGEQNAVILYSS